MTAGSPGQDVGRGHDADARGAAGLRIGVVLEAFGGWLVVEQDILPHGDRMGRAQRFARATQEQRHNRASLAERGL